MATSDASKTSGHVAVMTGIGISVHIRQPEPLPGNLWSEHTGVNEGGIAKPVIGDGTEARVGVKVLGFAFDRGA